MKPMVFAMLLALTPIIPASSSPGPVVVAGEMLATFCASDADACAYGTDLVWSSTGRTPPPTFGLNHPSVGPPLRGGFTLGGGVLDPQPPCITTAGRCSIIGTGDVSDAYCRHVPARATLTVTIDEARALIIEATWTASALTGVVVSSSPPGDEGRQVAGSIAFRGTDGGGNCGVTQPTSVLLASMQLTIA